MNFSSLMTRNDEALILPGRLRGSRAESSQKLGAAAYGARGAERSIKYATGEAGGASTKAAVF